MDSRLGRSIMVGVMAVGFFLSVGYALSSSHIHKGNAQQESTEHSQ